MIAVLTAEAESEPPTIERKSMTQKDEIRTEPRGREFTLLDVMEKLTSLMR
jgi:hypothetical protein